MSAKKLTPISFQYDCVVEHKDSYFLEDGVVAVVDQ